LIAVNRGGKRRGRRRSNRPANGAFAGALLAAIDLGTNNCRLLIAEADGQGGFRIVDSFSRIVRLGEKIALTGVLSEAAMDRTVAALKICADRLKRLDVGRVRAVATEACRQASNAKVLVERVAREVGLKLEIVAAKEEARLAALGCAPLVGGDYDGALVFDIGGGSTETIWIERANGKPKLQHYASVPIGVMTLAEAENGTPYPEMCAHMQARFAAVRREMDANGAFDPARHHLLGTSGTVTTLAGIALKLPRYVRSKVDGTWHDCATMQAVVDRLVVLNRAARADLGCVGDERADLIVPGCAIYSAIRSVWPCARLRVADRGLREGILRDLLTETNR
jgi:exopolyphosphatase / guanosine-5'-triphosphate,3'-diphosphate pyrophosphatase